MDLTGSKMPSEIRTFINEKISKDQSSAPLPEQCLQEIRTMAGCLVKSAKGSVSNLIRSAIFPLRLPGVIFEGGDTQWSTESPPKLAVSAPSITATDLAIYRHGPPRRILSLIMFYSLPGLIRNQPEGTSSFSWFLN
jgi:hypothetical protein